MAAPDAPVDPQRRRQDRLLSERIEAAMEPLHRVNRGLGVLRLLILLLPVVVGLVMYWRVEALPLACLWLLPAVVAYAFLMIATHDISHGTLLDLGPWEQALGCALSWPIAWPYRTYRNLHQLHHRMNGSDLRDPERREPSPEERADAGRWRRWHFDHPFWVSALVMGGAQLILSMVWCARRLRGVHSRLEEGLRADLLGILAVQLLIVAAALLHGQPLRLLLMILISERLVGAVMQTRGLIEHHGLWRRDTTYELTQLYSSRNIAAGPLVNLLMGGLPHHSLHHAYPTIPYDRLPEASAVAERILLEQGRPSLPRVAGYGAGVGLLL
ncbi:MAG: fatty acid desaturase [Synechococcaceae cyanobacterium]|nr:fatty acid desaturase [Synechococcaceae cyanobacterium]